MNFTIIEKSLNEINADYELIFVVNKDLNHKFIKDSKEFEFYNFKGEGVLNLPSLRRVYVGIKNTEPESIRQGVAKAFNAIKELNVKSIKMASYVDSCYKMSFEAIAEGFVLSAYKFDRYKSEKKSLNLAEILISTDEFGGKEIKLYEANLGLNHGKIIANATNFAKDIVNEIPEIYTPIKMEEDAKKLALEYVNLECKIHDENYLKAQNMNAFLAVNRASAHPPRLIHLKYTPKNESLKKIVFVGKGLTYDSGGLSLKPSDYMLTMKSDKSGAAAAMGIIKAACELELPFEIHAVLGATENMIGGDAYKPDDVLITRSGVSVEVRNTDAEGRLVLADCLDWAQSELNPDLLIDMATLTGACVVGLGEYTTGVMGNSYELQSEFKNFTKRSGENLTILEFNDHLRELVKSNIADISNTASSRYGGAITAGIFLDKFIKDEYKDKWLHLDIAGPAYTEKAWGYNQIGATGAGVRANLYYLNKLARNYEKGNK
ncbi:leucyl aminopeptidase, peptidase M17 family [Campylobacter iguaniorum]|uniref:leucyl aminopeptidase n=1 Tax=Campylobacter iguaniorum TaxID=1244531 RepID=UPI00073A04F5|nr:leucyl aminopeptidase [Campylobacter iguaniorum]ALV24870.1 leucyl aminopeptidase, peptidase M17 family [Campylobacter iguaniorum]